MRRLVPALLLAAAALTGCEPFGGDPAGSREPREPPRVDAASALEAMVARRAEALERGDGRALAATALGRQRARDRRAARRAARLGLRRVEMRIDGRRSRIRRGRSPLEVVVRYGIRGVSGTFTARRKMTVVRRGDEWAVVSTGGRRQQPPWEAGDFRRRPSRHFVVLAPAEIDVEAAGLLDVLESGYARIRSLLTGGTLRRRYLVLVARDAAQARRVTTRIRGLGGLAALTDTEVRQEGPAERVAEVASQRLLVVWPPFLAVDAEQRATVVTHELTHAAVAPATSGRTPAWLVEGLALYVSGDRRVGHAAQLLGSGGSRATRRVLTLAGLSGPDDIALLGGDAQAAAYAYASSAAFYIVERFGRRALLDLHDAYNDPSLVGRGGDPDLTDAATREVLGIGLRRLERDLRRWIVTQAVLDPYAP